MFGYYSTPISDADRAAFITEGQTQFGRSCNIEEVTLRYLVDFAVGDRASSAASPHEKKILQACATATDAASIIRRTQDPILDGSARLPGDMLIGLFGVAGEIHASQVGAAADTADLLAIAKGVNDGVLVARSGALRRFELSGTEFLSVGVGERVDVEGTNEADFGVKDRGWARIKPVLLGKDQQLTLSFWNGRTSDWPQAFSVLFTMRALIARTK
jgi:hypothetical protein